MLLSLLVIAILVALGWWAFPGRAAPAAPAALALLVLGIGVSAGGPALRTALDRGAVAPGVSEPGFDPDAGVAFGLDAGFVDWVAGHVPQDATYALRCTSDPCSESTRSWLVSRLAPRTPVFEPRDAEWLVLSGVAPPAGARGTVEQYDAARLLSVVKLRRPR
ncbi:MAG: hypothetical protein PGN13_14840 [Patulibacter minatonensis]